MRLLIYFLFISTFSFGQKSTPFSGRIVYSIEVTDTSLQTMYPPKVMQIYTNDTMVRVENETSQFGLQVAIRHIELNKSYLLISTPNGNYAIQTSLASETNPVSKFTFNKKMGGKKIANQKAKKLVVRHELFEKPMTFYYLKKVSSKYLDGFENFPGLLVEFYLPTTDVTYKYTLKSIEADPTNQDLYGVPSDFKKISMSDFVDMMTKQTNE